ncbi:NAD-dependent epimerase [Nonlabens sp. YIK11]|uniref:TIGR01777 family oxidoreductase n=1 Tax=Nonlabens sp. YIK11 TaxID=1453349 RepID=UPI0006DC839B|nr:TIGR01777 family oxidoreductase [Nonlabens sp. YIK11]KQC32710.1 NAD-dependent epimerase [Nonlabens sp. YIK11]
MKKIIIAGGTGFLGNALKAYFQNQNIQIISLSRKRTPDTTYWNGSELGEWTKHLEDSDVLINLAGKSVDCRYNDTNRKAIHDSRIYSTRVLNLAMQQAISKPKVFLNASTATIYAHSETQINTEENGTLGDDFSTGIAKAWEKEFFSVQLDGVRKVAMRTSIVLGNDGGAFPMLKKTTKLGMGGKQGRGNQFISWIHVQDFCRAVDFLIHADLEGAVNVTAPNPMQNENFMKLLSQQLNVPFRIDQPKWLLEIGAIFIGTETELLLKSRYVYPQHLMNSGFTFKYDTVESCLSDLV